MNAFKELVTPRNSSVPMRRFVHHPLRLPAGWLVDNKHSIQNSSLLEASSSKSLIHMMDKQKQKQRNERNAGSTREGEISEV